MSFLKGITKKDENATPESIEARVMTDLAEKGLARFIDEEELHEKAKECAEIEYGIIELDADKFLDSLDDDEIKLQRVEDCSIEEGVTMNLNILEIDCLLSALITSDDKKMKGVLSDLSDNFTDNQLAPVYILREALLGKLTQAKELIEIKELARHIETDKKIEIKVLSPADVDVPDFALTALKTQLQSGDIK